VRRLAVAALLLSGAASADPPTFVVAGEHGVLEVRSDGAVARELSKTPAERPRWSADRRRIFFLTRTELRAIDVEGGVETVVARLSGQVRICVETPDFPKGHRVKLDELAVQADEDFTVDARAACLSLMDRNLNMMNVELHVRVSLPGGRVAFGLTQPPCSAQPPCDPKPAPEEWSNELNPSFPYDVDDENQLIHREPAGGSVVAKLADYERHRGSRSGRWIVLRGNVEEEDLIHACLLLLDRRRGAIYALRAGKARALTRAQLRDVAKVETVGVVGETALRWLPGTPERLLVGRMLVEPGVRAVELPGDLIR
jgi:hypothetical protein